MPRASPRLAPHFFPHLFVSNKQNSLFLSTGNKQITKFSLLNSKYTSRHLKLFLRISPTLPQPLTLPPHYYIIHARTRTRGVSRFSCHTAIFANRSLTNRHFKNGCSHGNRTTADIPQVLCQGPAEYHKCLK